MKLTTLLCLCYTPEKQTRSRLTHLSLISQSLVPLLSICAVSKLQKYERSIQWSDIHETNCRQDESEPGTPG